MEDQKIVCIRCGTKNIEEHNADIAKNIICYWCANCGLRFTNFDFNLNRRIKYKLLSIQLNEFTQSQLLESCLQNLVHNGIERIMDPYYVHHYIFSGKNYNEVLFNLSFIETMFHHIIDTEKNRVE